MRRRATLSGLLTLLEKHGLLLQQDKMLPNVVAVVAGETLAGSWWNHAAAGMIFRRINELAAHPEVLVTKLVSGKVTFVHRRLWPAVLGMATAQEPWQLRGLSRPGRRLFDEVLASGMSTASGPPAKEVELRLLARGEQVHTDAGRHEIRLEAWREWSERVGCYTALPADEARRDIEAAVRALGSKGARLPWQSPNTRRGSMKRTK